MKKFSFRTFHENLKNDFKDADALIPEIERVEYNNFFSRGQNKSEYLDEQHEMNQSRLAEILEGAKLKIDFALEYLGLSKMAENFEQELSEYEGKFGVLEFHPYIDIFTSPPLFIITKYLNALTSHIKLDNHNINLHSIQLLERILRGTPKALYDRSVNPNNETEVKKEIYNVLVHVFPDTVKEIPISKVSKSYKPDFGIKHLKCAIEYKYVTSKEEAKISIGGIFEDISGYEGSKDWTRFYAVIYMTENFLTQDQIISEFKLSGVPHNWKPIVVWGPGTRKRRRVPKSKNK